MKNSNKIILGVFLAIVAGALAWSIMSQPSANVESASPTDLPGETIALATVNGQVITSDELNTVKSAFAQQGLQVTEDQALDHLINQVILSQEAKKGGYYMDDAKFQAELENQLSLQGVTVDEYKNQLESEGISYEKRIESIKEQLAIQEYLDAQFKDLPIATEQDAKELYESYKQQSPDGLPPYEQVKDQMLQLAQDQNQQEAIQGLIEGLKTNAEITY